MELSNKKVKDTLKKIDSKLNKNGKVTITVTGGDRYRDKNGKIRSSSNGKIIPESSQTSPHLKERGARAVDFTVDGANKKQVRDAVKGTDFDNVNYDDTYSKTNPYDNHIHASLTNEPKNYAENNSYSCK